MFFMKILTIFIIALVLVSSIFVIYELNDEEGGSKMEEERLYQGPVKPTDDEEHFRKTGETKPLEIEE